MREAFAKFDNMAMLWSIGKDSTALLWLARKAFFGHVPFPLVHIDTSYKIPSMIEYRDRLVREWNLQLVVGMNKPVLEAGETYPNGRRRVSNAAARSRRMGCSRSSSTTATPASSSACGATRIPRAPRNGTSRRAMPTWSGTRRTSRRSSGTSSRPTSRPGTHIRIHPLLHWTELNVWEYIEREKIPVIPLYLRRWHRAPVSVARLRAVHLSDQVNGEDGCRNRQRVESDQNPRAIRPRAGSGKRRRVREAQARRLHVMAYARNQLQACRRRTRRPRQIDAHRPSVLRHRLPPRRANTNSSWQSPSAEASRSSSPTSWTRFRPSAIRTSPSIPARSGSERRSGNT